MQRNMGKGVISFAYAVIWINLFLCSHGKCYSSITNIFKEFFYVRPFIQRFMFNKFTMREYVLEKRIKLERAEAFSLEMISAA